MAEFPWDTEAELERRYSVAKTAERAAGGGFGPMGLTPDAVKASAKYRAAKQELDAAFAALRAFNAKWASVRNKIPLEERMRRRQLKDALPKPVPVNVPKYNAEAVQKQIAKDPRIKGKEARLIHALFKGRTGDGAQIDNDAAEIVNAYKTRGEAAAKALYAAKSKGLKRFEQVVLDEKITRGIRGINAPLSKEERRAHFAKATDRAPWDTPDGLKCPKCGDKKDVWTTGGGYGTTFHCDACGYSNLRGSIKATDRSRMHRALDAVMDARGTGSQVDTDAVELANVYKTQGEAAARKLWERKSAGLKRWEQLALQEKMVKLIKAQGTDSEPFVGMLNSNPEKAKSLERTLVRKGYEYRFPSLHQPSRVTRWFHTCLAKAAMAKVRGNW